MNSVRISVAFTRTTEFGDYSDALWFTEAEYDALGQEEIDALGDARAAAWVARIKNPPPPPPPDPSPRVISKLDFRKRFTFPEQVAIDNFANSSLAPQQKAIVNTILNAMGDAVEVNLDDPLCIFGLGKLEEFGLLTVGRAAQLLA